MGLIKDMLHSTKSTNFQWFYYFSLLAKCVCGLNEMASQAGFGPRAVVWSNGWRPGPGEVGQGGQKVFHLLHHSQKACPQPKIFFECKLQDLPHLLTLQPGL